jgi:hypothetical protein
MLVWKAPPRWSGVSFIEVTALAIFRLATGRASMQLHFNDAGDIVAASASDRPRAVGNAVTPTPFAGEFSGYEVFDGVRIPTTAEVRWEPERRAVHVLPRAH